MGVSLPGGLFWSPANPAPLPFASSGRFRVRRGAHGHPFPFLGLQGASGCRCRPCVNVWCGRRSEEAEEPESLQQVQMYEITRIDRKPMNQSRWTGSWKARGGHCIASGCRRVGAENKASPQRRLDVDVAGTAAMPGHVGMRHSSRRAWLNALCQVFFFPSVHAPSAKA